MIKKPSRKQQAINAYEEELAKHDYKKRKEDTRRKILIGAMILGEMKNNPKTEKEIMERLDNFLDKPKDRELFGL